MDLDHEKIFGYMQFPNQIDIITKLYKTDEVENKPLDFFFSSLYPIWYHRWSKVKCVQLFEFEDKQRYDISFNEPTTQTNVFKLPKPNLEHLVHIKGAALFIHTIQNQTYFITEEALAYIYFREAIQWKDITLPLIYGLVQAGNHLSIYSSDEITEKNTIRKNNPFNNAVNPIQRISLKSLKTPVQLQLFKSWRDRETVILTGGTGVGKTSQIPKLIMWFNFLFGNCELNAIEWNPDQVGNKKPVVLSLPRVELVKQNGSNMLNSFGFVEFNSSPIKLQYREIINEPQFQNNAMPDWGISIITHRITLKNIKDYSDIIVDEIHEHDIMADIVLTIAKHDRKSFNSIVAMSATLDSDRERIKDFFNPTFIHIPGETLYNITEVDKGIVMDFYNNPYTYLHTEEAAIKKAILTYPPGLGFCGIVFLSRVLYIKNLYQKFKDDPHLKSFKFYIIHSKVENIFSILKEIQSTKERCIILATPYLESSITITNAKVVYDTGRYWQSSFYSGKEVFISQSMSAQRKGRVGRTSPGTYITFFKVFEEVKKIDHEYLFPYVINLNKYNLANKEYYIEPTDQSRKGTTLKYLTNLFPLDDLTTTIYDKFLCEMIEYIAIFRQKDSFKDMKNYEETQIMTPTLREYLRKLNLKVRVESCAKFNDSQQYKCNVKFLFGPERNIILTWISHKYLEKDTILQLITPNILETIRS